jgi:PncC family amidohydrolase
MKARLPNMHFSEVSRAKALGRLLVKKGLSVATAESCTGGMIGAALTSVPGSSAWFKGGVIAYANSVKRRLLGVPSAILDNKGAVSAETVRAMARGAQRLFATGCALAVSGVAGPDGGTKEKPVGLVYVGLACGKNVRSYEYRFEGDRREIRRQAVEKALEMMIKELR